MHFVLWLVMHFVLWLTACFVGYKLAKSKPADSGDWLVLFIAICFLLFISNRLPGVSL